MHKIAYRVGRYLERQGWLERDAGNDYLGLDTADDDPLSVLHGHSISYRIALGPQAGRKAFTLQTLPAPKQAKALAVPVDQGLRLDYSQCVLPVEESEQQHKADPECCTWPTRLQVALLVHRELFTQEQIFGSECAKWTHEKPNESGHLTQKGRNRW